MKKLFIFALLILLTLGASAQRRRRAKTPPPPTPEELAEMARKEKYDRKLQAIERVTFIDSSLLKKSEVMDVLSLGNETGSVHQYTKFFASAENDTLDCTLFLSQLGDKIIYAQPDTASVLHLYASEMIGQKWSKRVALPGLEDSVSHNYPFMLTDGSTLYYASKSEEGLGGYDIYMTRWDDDDQRFLKPENIGMPFNSPANDYLYLIDEFNQLGWFVTDRGQNADTVCLYCFIPNEVRRIYNAGELGHDTLVAYADIRSIKDTWVDKNRVAEAQDRLLSIRNKTKKSKDNRFRFVINDMITYTNFTQFRHEESRKLAERWLSMTEERDETYRKLDTLRKQYSDANAQDKPKLSEAIIPLEERYEILIIDINSLEKEIRAYEQR